MTESSEELTLHFGTRAHEINAATLAASLESIEAVVRELSRENPHAITTRLQIRAFERGSFDVIALLQQMQVRVRFSPPLLS